MSRLVAAAFDRSVHLKADDLMASIVSGWVDPNLPEAERQNEAIGGVLAVSAMSFVQDGLPRRRDLATQALRRYLCRWPRLSSADPAWQ